MALYRFRLDGKCLKSVCHMFFFSFLSFKSLWLFFVDCLAARSLARLFRVSIHHPFPHSSCILEESFGAALIFVWSVQSCFLFPFFTSFLFSKTFQDILLARAGWKKTKKYANCSKRNFVMWCCSPCFMLLRLSPSPIFLVFSLFALIMEHKTLRIPCAKAISLQH
jgi:hypothetical protein